MKITEWRPIAFSILLAVPLGWFVLGDNMATLMAEREAALSGEESARLTEAIAGAGYSCPVAKFGFPGGIDDNGASLRVVCVTIDDGWGDEETMFRVTTGQEGQLFIEPWEE